MVQSSSIKNLISLKGRRALITGATGGLGFQMATTLSELGADLILLDQPGSNYKNIIETINQINDVSIETINCDLEDESSRSETIKHILEQNLGLNILINNAAFTGTSNLQGWATNFEEQTVATWRRAIEVNLTAIFDFCKGLAETLRESGNASIINVASIYGVVAPDYSIYEGTDMGNASAYAVSKGGLIQLTRWLSTTLAPEIRVNSISPGGILRNNLPESFVEAYEKKTPLSRMAKDEDFKGITAFLASDLSKYVTGQNILVDGGWTVW